MSIVLRSRRGAIGTSWHAVALRRGIETILGVNRAAGGKAAARAGRVQWLDVAPGTARADVLDDLGELRSARLDVAPLRGEDREVLLRVARSRPELAARLLAGEYPQEVESELARHEISLLPAAASDVWHDCSCLDWPGPCAHVAALAYVLVEAVDEHPVHLLTLRGVTLEDLTAPRAAHGGTVGAGGGSADGAGGGTGDDGAADAREGTAGDPATDVPGQGLFDARLADASLLLDALGAETASILARLYGCADAADRPDVEPGRSVEGG